jgi:HD-GYP domain-containing protein (c-di-GMP phosphodiesterase class II)
LMVALGRQLGFDEALLRDAGMAGLLHDLGKALIPLEILNKPGKLTDAEFAIVKKHPQDGYDLLEGNTDRGSLAARDVSLHHHEKFNGTGYPKRLEGESISVLSRMAAVCDVYDAITSNRPYKTGWDPAESLRQMAVWTKEGHFETRIFQAFVKSIGIYPTGSLVKLQSGRLGVVLEQNEKSALTPRIKAFFSIKSNMHIMPEIIDLSAPHTRERIVGREIPEDWKITNLEEIWMGVAARKS